MAKSSRQSGGRDRSLSPSHQGHDLPPQVTLKGSRGDGTVTLLPPRRWPLLVALASTFGVVLGVVVIALNLASVSAPVSGVARAPVGPAAALQGPDRRSLGNPNAPVVVTEWSDFQCPACRLYALNREPSLEKEYVEAGKVRFVYRNFAFLGPESILAAEAAECAADQGRYWDYRSTLWQRQRGENQGAFRPENLKGFAAELGLDQAKFDACLDNGTHRAEVLAEEKEGEALGVNATPTLFINSRKMQGVPSLDTMKAAIEEELAKK